MEITYSLLDSFCFQKKYYNTTKLSTYDALKSCLWTLLTRLLHSLLNSVQILPVELYMTYISPNVLQDWSVKKHFREEGENREAGKLSEMTHISIKQADMRKDCCYNGHLQLFVPRPEPSSFL